MMKQTATAKAGDLLSSDDVIDRLCAEPWLRRRAATCILPAVRVGSEWRFRRSDLDAWVATRKREEGQQGKSYQVQQ